MNPTHYWVWYMTYILAWQVLLPTVVTGFILGLLSAKYSRVSPLSFALRTILAGNLFDVVVIGAELHIAHKPILPALFFLPTTYGFLWVVYGLSMALGAWILLWRKYRWVGMAQRRARSMRRKTKRDREAAKQQSPTEGE